MKTKAWKRVVTVFTGIVLFGGTAVRAGLSDGLVAHFPLDGDASDASGQGNHGTLIGGAAFGPDRSGSPNGACDFNGASAFILVPESSNLDLDSFTVATWVLPREANRYQALVNKVGYGEDPTVDGNYLLSLMVDLRPRAEYEFIGSTLNRRCESATALSLNQWQHVAITREAASGRLAVYVNGVVTCESVYFEPPNQQDQPLRIGADPFVAEPGNDYRYFNGMLDEVRIYNRALSEAEIRELAGVSCFALYAQDFSSDPGWTTDDPAKLGWDAASGTFHGTQMNTEGSYAYINLPNFDPNKAWRLELDHRINRCDWSAGFTFGLMDARTSYPYSAGLDCGIGDRGYATTLWGLDGVYSPAWVAGVWYHDVFEYDPVTQVLSLTVTELATGTRFMQLTRPVASLPPDMTRLGVSRLHMKGYPPGASPYAAVDYNFDNISLCQAVPPAVDTDGDGVPDASDQCPSTPAGDVVNAAGCSISQLVPATWPWRNHGEYVAAVAHVAAEFMAQGLINGAQRGEVVAAAAGTAVGKRR